MIRRKITKILFDENYNIVAKLYSHLIETDIDYKYVANIRYSNRNGKIDLITISQKNPDERSKHLASIKGEEIEKTSISTLQKLNKKDLLENLSKKNSSKKAVKPLFLYSVLIESSQIA